MESFSYKLQHPKTIRDKEHSELTIRRPLVRDLIAADRQPGVVASDAALLATCSGMTFADFGHLDADDYRGLMALGETHGFFPRTRGDAEPGATSSS